jgi:hypothetical protein
MDGHRVKGWGKIWRGAGRLRRDRESGLFPGGTKKKKKEKFFSVSFSFSPRISGREKRGYLYYRKGQGLP